MGDYFSNLAARTMGLSLPIEPRPVSRFERASDADFLGGSNLFASDPGEDTLFSESGVQSPSSTSYSTRPAEQERAINHSSDGGSDQSDDLPRTVRTEESRSRETAKPSRVQLSSQMPAPLEPPTASMSERQTADSSVAFETAEQQPVSSRGIVSDSSEARVPRLVEHSPHRAALSRFEASEDSGPRHARYDFANNTQPPKSDGPSRRPSDVGRVSVKRFAPAIDPTQRAPRVESIARSTSTANESTSRRKAPTPQSSFFASRREREPLTRQADGARSPVRPGRISRAIDSSLARSESAAPELAGAEVDSPPTVQITIGRVEVKAVSSPATKPVSAATAKPAMSLDDYLRKRSSGVK